MRVYYTTYELLSESRSGYCSACDRVTVPGKARRNDRGSATVAPAARNWECPECKQKTLFGAEAARLNGGLQIGG